MNIPSHGKYKWLPKLYNAITALKPSKIIEFGPAGGQTTITMAMALKDNNVDGFIKSKSKLKYVVFPAPLFPTSPKLCPLGISNWSILRTWVPLYDFDKSCVFIMVILY